MTLSESTRHYEQPITFYSDTRLRVLYHFITRYNTAGEQHPFKGFNDFKKNFYKYQHRKPEVFAIREDKRAHLEIIDDFLARVEHNLKAVDFMAVTFDEPDVFNQYFRVTVTVDKKKVKGAHLGHHPKRKVE